MDNRIEVVGLVEVRANVERAAEALHGTKMMRTMRECALLMLTEAKLRVPVDTGRLRGSIMAETRSTDTEVMGVVGTIVKYAPDVEFGTKPHVVPIASLQPWARRKGVSAEAVASAIAKRGTKAKKFMADSFKAHESTVKRKLEATIAEIVAEANS